MTDTKKLIDKLEKDIMDLTGLTKKQLDTMDMGDIERHLGIEATDPAKRKSLYRIISSEEQECREKLITHLLKDNK